MTTPRGVDRRTFLKLVGGGVVVLVRWGPEPLLAQERRSLYPTDFNLYLRIGNDGRVSVFSGKIEMGQGVMTSMAQMAAEELRVSLDVIDMVMGDTDRCPWDMGTFGSLTTRMFGPALLAAAAEAHEVLLQLAAEKLEVAPDQLKVVNGVVSLTDNPEHSVTYAELTEGRAIARELDGKAVLRAVGEFTVMGRSPNRLDARAKVTGAALYAGDIHLSGMLYAKLLRPPAHGATLVSVDTSAAAKIEGVSVVQEQDLVAVLHANPETAQAALDRVTAKWKEAPPGADQDGIFDELLQRAPAPQVTASKGDVTGSVPAGARVFESTFNKGYVAHAPMEPHTATAQLEEGKLTVWASTQTPFPTRDRLAAALGMSSEQVRVITPYVGGGFGGKSAGRQAEEAARLAKLTGKPVQVAWTRAEEFFYDTFDPAAIITIRSAVTEDGAITLWDEDIYLSGDRGAALFYDIPNQRLRVSGSWRGQGQEVHRFGVGPWRGPGANMNIYARESHIDTMAAAIGLDPLELRLRNLSDERMRRVLAAAAKQFGWKPATAPSGRGWGIACGEDAGSYVALMAEVAVNTTKGTVEVERVVCAQDMGVVVNPVGATMQIEGCIMMGLGYVLTEELHFSGGQILDTNFDTYQLPRFSWLPRIEAVLVPHDDLAPQGGGEPAIVAMGAVISNAVFDACGARMQRLPMTPQRLQAALTELKEAQSA